MSKVFYSLPEYRRIQREKVAYAWKSGKFNHLYKRIKRQCDRPDCKNVFSLIPSNPKKFCSSHCAAHVNNKKRGAHREETKQKIAESLRGTQSPFKGINKVERVEKRCCYLNCGKIFIVEPWKKTKFCSNLCAMKVIGGQATSPRAARAKAGIRLDINSSCYFYSRWEANLARLLNLFDVTWVHQPKTFDLGNQKYTPDFYLPELDLYIEVKNFLAPYSKKRDERFRKAFPNLHLKLLLKEEYLNLEKTFSSLIPCWEYSNSKFQ